MNNFVFKICINMNGDGAIKEIWKDKLVKALVKIALFVILYGLVILMGKLTSDIYNKNYFVLWGIQFNIPQHPTDTSAKILHHSDIHDNKVGIANNTGPIHINDVSTPRPILRMAIGQPMPSIQSSGGRTVDSIMVIFNVEAVGNQIAHHLKDNFVYLFKKKGKIELQRKRSQISFEPKEVLSESPYRPLSYFINKPKSEPVPDTTYLYFSVTYSDFEEQKKDTLRNIYIMIGNEWEEKFSQLGIESISQQSKDYRKIISILNKNNRL